MVDPSATEYEHVGMLHNIIRKIICGHRYIHTHMCTFSIGLLSYQSSQCFTYVVVDCPMLALSGHSSQLW